jgi:hypothetical protein
MEKTPEGSQWMARVVLRPGIHFSGTAPDAARLHEVHEPAHHAALSPSRSRPRLRSKDEGRPMSRKVAVVDGATSGGGRDIAMMLG